MYSRILVAYDGSPDGVIAIERAAALAKAGNAEISVLAVLSPSVGALAAASAGSANIVDIEDKNMRDVLAEGVGMLRQRGLSAHQAFATGEPAQEICAAAKRANADLIVLGHRARGALARLWQGSVGDRVLAHAPCSVLIAVGE